MVYTALNVMSEVPMEAVIRAVVDDIVLWSVITSAEDAVFATQRVCASHNHFYFVEYSCTEALKGIFDYSPDAIICIDDSEALIIYIDFGEGEIRINDLSWGFDDFLRIDPRSAIVE